MALPVGIVLAAGDGRRFGSDKRCRKLPDGRTILEQVIDHALQALPSVTVALRPDDAGLQQALIARGNARLQCVSVAGASKGMGHTLAAVIGMTPSAAGWVILLGDMPFIQPSTIKAVAEGLGRSSIVQPVWHGRPGHPVGFSAVFASALQALHGDRGARPLIDKNSAAVLLLSVDDPGIHQDVDTVADLLQIQYGNSG